MLRRFIQSVEVFPPADAFSSEERKALRANFHLMAARRMSALPLMLGQVSQQASISPNDEIVFASEFCGTQALEAFLKSFPQASPTGFQNSTQPGAASLVLVARKQPVSGFTPVTGGVETVERALLLSLCSDNETIHFWGGEEKGNWMPEKGLAAPKNFAFYLELSKSDTDALGTLTLTPEPARHTPLVETPSTEAFTRAMMDQLSIHFASESGGFIEISWR
ncbi:hypothetical protein [Rubellicoccus peritrichatus]|uniref:Uncharacterized protein n=1 Tax=Rubellicoccus peritrichatus TaxID=3080537 RepID=A0AAQ3LD93_9BACT|nr:hypothetical protein [Puniceicoccus sp. CR14]WOO42324.1 hypothetical protein RZN69_04425 [Puniceicoccus sp. CR14]